MMKIKKGTSLLNLALLVICGIGLLILFLMVLARRADWPGWSFTPSSNASPAAANTPMPEGSVTLPPPFATLPPAVSPTPVLKLANQSLQFDNGEHLRLGVGPGLGLTTFTIETWFMRTGDGSAVALSPGGILAVPLITKGFVGTDQIAASINYFLGIRADQPVLVVDFVEAEGQTSPGLHHSVSGVTLIPDGAWHHAAATFDGIVLRLYLDGNLENSEEVGPNRLPAFTGQQYTSLAAVMNAHGEAVGYFSGLIDETRMWNLARSQAEIQSVINQAVENTSGLMGRWGFDEGSGQIVNGSAGSRLKGVIHASKPNWTAGTPFDMVFLPPQAPANLAVMPGGAYRVDLHWLDVGSNEIGFEIERIASNGRTEIQASLPVNATAYQDWQVLPQTEYCYRMRAVNLQGTSDYTPMACVVTPAESSAALSLGEDGAFLTIENTPRWDMQAFTVETWFRWTGSGTPYSTGPGGLAQAIPLVTYAGYPADGSEMATGWALAIDAATGALAADLLDSSTGQPHPIIGTTPISSGGWHHAAVSYDGGTLRLYLDGQLESVSEIYLPVQTDPTFRLGLGVIQSSDGIPLGLFQGALDEVRLWNISRSHAQILAEMNTPLNRAEGLAARWGFGEGEGDRIHDSVGQSDGLLIAATPAWLLPGAPFNLVAVIPPENPILLSPVVGGPGTSTTLPLQVMVDDVNRQDLKVTFYGRSAMAGTEVPFTIVALPDTQNYSLSDSRSELFKDQSNWIVNQQDILNIQFVSHLGDITEHGNIEDEWQRVDQALDILDQAGVRYGLIPGNHDMAEDYNDYGRYFPPSRYQGREWYGGFLGDPTDGIPDFGVDRQNKDNYQLFSVGSMDFIIINLEIDPPQFAIDWATALLQAYSDRLAVITTHLYLNAKGLRSSAPYIDQPGHNSAETVWQQLVYPNCNVIMVLNGHDPGEARRTDSNACGEPVYQLLQDYQYRSNGGDGWLRYLVFEPAEDEIEVYTYSPSLNEFENDGNSRFTLSFPMSGPAPFVEIGSVVVPAGSLAEVTWPDLTPGSVYEWYVVVSDGQAETSSETWSFVTH